jgi:hypothetical protein
MSRGNLPGSPRRMGGRTVNRGEVMAEARAQADRGRSEALDALLFGFDQAFTIEVTADGEWRWRRLDGLGGWTTASGPDELSGQLRDASL